MDEREQMLVAAKKLKAQDQALRRDECGIWVINGKNGNVQPWGDGRSFLLYVSKPSPRAWTAAKKKLDFCEVTQDGDEEGCLHLWEMPIAEQLRAIREVLGIKKKRELTEEAIAALTLRGQGNRFQPRQVPKRSSQA